jgi:hypothetical protein
VSAPGDELPILDPPQRVSGMRVPAEGEWSLPGKPEGLTPTAEDAWRQSSFLLGDDLRLLDTNLRLQLRLAATGYEPRARTMRMAALASLWSRAFSSTADAASLYRRGAYQGALPLVRQAVEFIAAQSALPAEYDEFKRWAHQAFGRHAATRAEDIGLGHYFAGETIAGDDHLRAIYRAASDLGRPNFGPAALFAAAGATRERYPLVFADDAFHLGWAQLIGGWLLRLGARQLHIALHTPEQFPAPPDLRPAAVEHVRTVERHLEDPARCRIEEYVDEDGRRRHLIVEFRRRPSDATKRLLL